MQLAPVALEPIGVQAGTFRLGNLPDVTLNDLDVVRTPGSAADPFRAIQTFPGVQSFGDGAGLFVRGGDIAETRVLLDGATVISPFRLDTDHTFSQGRFDPFMLKGVHFSAGGFGAEYSDALSAIVDLQTVDKPLESKLEVTAAIGGLSGSLDFDATESHGARVTGTYTNTDVLMRMNGRRDEFDRVPRSTDLSGSFEWAYGDDGSVKSFAMLQTDLVGVRLDDPAYSGVYSSDARSDLVALSGFDIFGTLGLSWGVATSGSRKDEDFGAFRLNRDDRLSQARAKVELPMARGISLTLGAEAEHRGADLAGSVPTAPHDNAPGSPAIVFSGAESGDEARRIRRGRAPALQRSPPDTRRAGRPVFVHRAGNRRPQTVGDLSGHRSAHIDRSMGRLPPGSRRPALRNRRWATPTCLPCGPGT